MNQIFAVSHWNLQIKIHPSALLVYCCITVRSLIAQVKLVVLHIHVIPPHLSSRKICGSVCIPFGYSPFSPRFLSDALLISLTSSAVNKLHKWNHGPNEVKGNFAIDLNEIWISSQETICLHVFGFPSFLILPSVTPNHS